MAFLTVNAEVTRVFYNGLGIGLKESFTKRDGETGASYYTAWFEEDPNLSEGDKGKFSGLFSVRKSEYEKDGETRHGVDITLNSTRYEAVDGGSGSDDEAPF